MSEQLANRYLLERMKIKPYATPSDIKDAFIEGWNQGYEEGCVDSRHRERLISLAEDIATANGIEQCPKHIQARIKAFKDAMYPKTEDK